MPLKGDWWTLVCLGQYWPDQEPAAGCPLALWWVLISLVPMAPGSIPVSHSRLQPESYLTDLRFLSWLVTVPASQTRAPDPEQLLLVGNAENVGT